MRERYEKWKKFFIFVISLGLLLLFGALVVFSNHWLNLLNGFLISGSIVTSFGLLGFFFIKERIRELINTIQELPEPVSSKEEINVEPIQQSNVINSKRKQKTKQSKSRYRYIKFTRVPKNSNCKISKTQFKENDRIIRCSNCFSCYLEFYFLKWISENNICPVCRVVYRKK